MDTEFFKGWFEGLSRGLDGMTDKACDRLFSACAQTCGQDALAHLYRTC